ncbi:serine hydrolase [Streptomonospora sp. PA3]|uniref:serine hydrolase domain-containing protein n=1 Tax=Streptomonospora sp. PA3 TaxID=2607326 RepID=UPI0012DD7DB4|nr:serine hydrolase domain-containing protein [Streptomonospora sp. PA3]MUL41975.1 serine hydrolase [Streptomonospora sp. PA3]
MRRWIPAVGAALLAAALPVCAAAEGPVHAGDRPGGADTAQIDAFVERYVDEQGLAGVSVALVRRGEILHTAGYGHDSAGRPVTEDTPMMVASLAKSMTAMAVMRLAEAGEVDLDAPVRRYLPRFRPTDPRAARITVRHLLDHSSGLASGLLSPDRQAKESLREAVAILETMEPAAEPGVQHRYFNGNYWLLARMVETVTGERFGDHLDAAVFTPLGMDDTVAFENTGRAVEEIGGLQTGHASAYGTTVPAPEPADFAAGAGGVASTAADMARWLAPYTSGGRTADGEPFTSAATVEEMLTPSAPGGRYALGWRDGTPAGSDRPRMSHGGASFGYSAYQGLYHRGEYGVAVLSNTFTAPVETAYPIAAGIMDIVEGRTPPASAPVNAAADYLLAALTAVSAALGVRRAVRARAWARRFGGRSRLRPAARLAPRLLPFALVCGFAALVALSGADAGFLRLWIVWPALGVWGLVAALANLATFCLRIGALRRVAAECGPPQG